MSVARAGHSATLFADGRVFIAGGDSGGSAEIYDPAANSFTGARREFGYCAFDAFGGVDAGWQGLDRWRT